MLLVQPRTVTYSLSHFGRILAVTLSSAFSPRNQNAPEMHLTTMAKRICIDSARTLLTKIFKKKKTAGLFWLIHDSRNAIMMGRWEDTAEEPRRPFAASLSYRSVLGGLMISEVRTTVCQGQSHQLLPQQNTPHSYSSFMLLPHTSISQINFSGKLPYQILPCVGGPGE